MKLPSIPAAGKATGAPPVNADVWAPPAAAVPVAAAVLTLAVIPKTPKTLEYWLVTELNMLIAFFEILESIELIEDLALVKAAPVAVDVTLCKLQSEVSAGP